MSDPGFDRRDDRGGNPGPRSQGELIVRIDERTNVLLQEIRTIKETTVTRAEFSPVKALVYGLVGLIMTSVLVAILSVVVTGR